MGMWSTVAGMYPRTSTGDAAVPPARHSKVTDSLLHCGMALYVRQHFSTLEGRVFTVDGTRPLRCFDLDAPLWCWRTLTAAPDGSGHGRAVVFSGVDAVHSTIQIRRYVYIGIDLSLPHRIAPLSKNIEASTEKKEKKKVSHARSS